MSTSTDVTSHDDATAADPAGTLIAPAPMQLRPSSGGRARNALLQLLALPTAATVVDVGFPGAPSPTARARRPRRCRPRPAMLALAARRWLENEFREEATPTGFPSTTVEAAGCADKVFHEIPLISPRAHDPSGPRDGRADRARRSGLGRAHHRLDWPPLTPHDHRGEGRLIAEPARGPRLPRPAARPASARKSPLIPTSKVADASMLAMLDGIARPRMPSAPSPPTKPTAGQPEQHQRALAGGCFSCVR
ncbi:hypothetical protein HBB16_07690 [Pseudonocardia sp. MCCB 268]|nr:hypothetical protein [Pseudonocardia cytotoxica]